MSKEKNEAVMKFTEWLLEMLSKAIEGNPGLQAVVESMSSRDILQLCLECVVGNENEVKK